MSAVPLPLLMPRLVQLALDAGAAVLRHARAPDVTFKADGSPVTAADAEAEAIILAGLAALCPGLPVIAEEETAARGIQPSAPVFFLVDPLDGTREYVGGKPDYTVNIALIEQGVPVLGVVHAPALGELWCGSAAGAVAGRVSAAALSGSLAPIHTRAAPAAGLTALVSRSHNTAETEAELARWPVADRMAAGSSLKFCRIAEGRGDIYPRLGPIMEWDTAAGDAVLRAAGGCTVDAEGAPLRYGRADAGYRLPRFIAFGDTGLVSVLRGRAPA